MEFLGISLLDLLNFGPIWPYMMQLSSTISGCVNGVADWMQSNRLQLNPGKMELLWCTTSLCQNRLPTATLTVGSSIGTLIGLPIHLIRCLQSVQNAAARLIFRLRRSDHITEALISLHWLRVPERIVFKVAVHTYRALHGDAPQYLRQFTQVADIPSRQRPVFHLGRSVRSCRQTAYCWTSCFLCRWRSCSERSSCRRHFSTFSVHFPKTSKTASFSTLLSWPCPLS